MFKSFETGCQAYLAAPVEGGVTGDGKSHEYWVPATILVNFHGTKVVSVPFEGAELIETFKTTPKPDL